MTSGLSRAVLAGALAALLLPAECAYAQDAPLLLERGGRLDTIGISPAGAQKRKTPAMERIGIERQGVQDALVIARKDPLVMLTEPGGGVVSRSRQRVSGRIGGGITKAFIRINDDTRIVPVSDGRFETYAALRPGLNTITALAWDLEGNLGKSSMSVFMRPDADGPSVRITEPADGSRLDITRDRVVTIRAVAGDKAATEGVLVVNNVPRRVKLEGGDLRQELALMPGVNEIFVEVSSPSGRTGTSRPVRVHTFDAAPKDLVATLTWDSADADMDLHVWDSFGHHTFADARDPYQCEPAIPKGMLDMDRKGGFGPEVFSLESAEPEVYTFYVNYNPGMGGAGGSFASLALLLYGDEPARRIMRVFGPAALDAGNPSWEAAHVKMPEGVFFQEKDADLKKTLGMDARAVARLALMLKEENLPFALLAASAMGQIKSEEAVNPLAEALARGQVELRRAAAGALWNIRSVMSVPALVAALSDPDADVRQAAAGALGAIGDAKAVYALSGLLAEEGDPQVRVEAIRALGAIGDGRAIETLASLARNPDPVVRIAAVRALGGIDEPRSGTLAVGLLRDETPGVREAAARAVGRLGMRDAARELMDLLYFDEDEGVRVQAAVALGRLGVEDARPELERAMDKDQSARVRFCAMKAVEELTPGPEPVKPAAGYAPLEEEEDLVIY